MRAKQQGMVFLVALALVLAMTALGVGLLQFARRTAAQVERSGVSEVLRGAAETCIQEAMQWLEQAGASAPPCESQGIGSQCGSTITGTLSDWSAGSEGQLLTALAQSTTYSCSIHVASRETLGASSGAGFEVGQTQAYGKSEALTKYLFRVSSQASGRDGASVGLEVVASMVY